MYRILPQSLHSQKNGRRKTRKEKFGWATKQSLSWSSLIQSDKDPYYDVTEAYLTVFQLNNLLFWASGLCATTERWAQRVLTCAVILWNAKRRGKKKAPHKGSIYQSCERFRFSALMSMEIVLSSEQIINLWRRYYIWKRRLAVMFVGTYVQKSLILGSERGLLKTCCRCRFILNAHSASRLLQRKWQNMDLQKQWNKRHKRQQNHTEGWTLLFTYARVS